MGNIKKSNDRITLIIPKELKEKYKIIADNEKRTMSNLTLFLIEKYVNEHRKDEG